MKYSKRKWSVFFLCLFHILNFRAIIPVWLLFEIRRPNLICYLTNKWQKRRRIYTTPKRMHKKEYNRLNRNLNSEVQFHFFQRWLTLHEAHIYCFDRINEDLPYLLVKPLVSKGQFLVKQFHYSSAI